MKKKKEEKKKAGKAAAVKSKGVRSGRRGVSATSMSNKPVRKRKTSAAKSVTRKRSNVSLGGGGRRP